MMTKRYMLQRFGRATVLPAFLYISGTGCSHWYGRGAGFVAVGAAGGAAWGPICRASMEDRPGPSGRDEYCPNNDAGGWAKTIGVGAVVGLILWGVGEMILEQSHQKTEAEAREEKRREGIPDSPDAPSDGSGTSGSDISTEDPSSTESGSATSGDGKKKAGSSDDSTKSVDITVSGSEDPPKQPPAEKPKEKKPPPPPQTQDEVCVSTRKGVQKKCAPDQTCDPCNGCVKKNPNCGHPGQPLCAVAVC